MRFHVKYLSLLVLLGAMVGQVKPLPNDDPKVKALAAQMQQHHLKWKLSIGMSGENYCLTARAACADGEDTRTVCRPTVREVTKWIIANFGLPEQQCWKVE